jgi:hypothetical protein
MSMSINLHTQTADKFTVSTKIANHDLSWNNDNYAIIQISAAPKGSYDYQEISIFPSFEQVKQLHQELSKLMKEIEELENVPAEDKTELSL